MVAVDLRNITNPKIVKGSNFLFPDFCYYPKTVNYDQYLILNCLSFGYVLIDIRQIEDNVIFPLTESNNFIKHDVKIFK